MSSIARLDAAAKRGSHPTAAMLMAFPAACFIGTFVTDFIYWRSAAPMWVDFSIWLLVAGLIASAFAVLATGIGLLMVRGRGEAGIAWPRAVGNTLALVLSIFNAFVHSRDGYTAVVPTGIILSAVVVLILLFTGWIDPNHVAGRRAKGVK